MFIWVWEIKMKEACGKFLGHTNVLFCVVVTQGYTIVRTQLNTLRSVRFIMLIVPHILRTYSVFKIQICTIIKERVPIS